MNPSLLNPNAASPCRTRRLLDCRSGNRVRLVRLSRLRVLPFTAIQHNQPDHQEAYQEKDYPELFRFAIHFVSFQRRELRCPVSGFIFSTKPICLSKNSHLFPVFTGMTLLPSLVALSRVLVHIIPFSKSGTKKISPFTNYYTYGINTYGMNCL